ncbi:MAG: Fe-S-cluster-containing hydrogenase component 2, HycB [Candidatus Methanohalarchaeum thermophilum]|uniref:Fe-S-cluster-containing hydrogenase component 2, HycB n=1 Tax=Methanohalarchaeum thermophilum TaxID=1903181 RepID=A0A1Q6DWW0_METT1|nr:MAG: Fe-S-cluster-containing hydrogenase component 2, HycB [Candidatus Methanohalarchaeum thermophilum]
MVNRRDFLKGIAGGAGAAVAGFALGSLTDTIEKAEGRSFEEIKTMVETPPSEAYLLVDREKCAGCRSCMLACSLAHEGKENLSLSRIQVFEDPLAGFPDDLVQEQCRQCQYPECVAACPTGALSVDEVNGNVRLVDEEKCIGCQRCIEACDQINNPARAAWNHEDEYSLKCDLCIDTPHWEENGGPDGKQACVEICPVNAIKTTDQIPVQIGQKGYKVNLRGKNWEKLGFPSE